MRSLPIVALFLVLAMRADSGLRHCTFRVHIAANGRDESVFAQPIRSLTRRGVFLEKNAWLSERDVTFITHIERRPAPTPRRSNSMTTGALSSTRCASRAADRIYSSSLTAGRLPSCKWTIAFRTEKSISRPA